MTFTYPAVFTPHKDDKGFHVVFPDLECCEADGPDLEDAVENAREAAYNWLYLEVEEQTYDFPAQSHIEDMELEEGEFEPMFNSIEGKLSGKKIALFGSYGWGSGEWMETWEEDSLSKGAILAAPSVIANEAPDDEASESCRNLGKALV